MMLLKLWRSFWHSRLTQTIVHFFQFLYIRWRVFTTIYSDTDPEHDSLASSMENSPRHGKIIRTNSVYPPLFSADNGGPGCIEMYNQFMNYGSMNPSVSIENISKTPEPIFDIPKSLVDSNSNRSSFAYESSDYSPKFTSHRNIEIDNHEDDKQVQRETSRSVLDESDVETMIESPRIRRLLPTIPPVSHSHSLDLPTQSTSETFEQLLQIATQNAQTPTYPEIQRQIRNYFFTAPRYIENVTEDSENFASRPTSSKPQEKIPQRFAERYWKIEENCGANPADDTYHNRFFGKMGYHLTWKSNRDLENGLDVMPIAQKMELKREKLAWERVNRFGGDYENFEIQLPDTNGLHTNCWEQEYEQRLEPYGSVEWKIPRKYAARYSSLF